MPAQAKPLWGYVDGEPFMINPRLGILGLMNSRKKKSTRRKSRKNTTLKRRNSKKSGGSTMARKSSRAHMAWVRSFKKNKRRKNPRRHHVRRSRSRARRRNAYPMAGLAINPRRRRRRTSVRRHRRNPSRARRYAERGLSIMGVSLPPLQAVLYAGVGFVGTPVLESYINPILPVSITGTTIGKYAVRIGSVLGLTWIAKAILGPQQAKMVAIGGGMYVAVSAIKEFAPGVVPGLSAYVPSGPRGLSAYVPAKRQLSGGGIPVFGAASNIVPVRFDRFNRLG